MGDNTRFNLKWKLFKRDGWRVKDTNGQYVKYVETDNIDPRLVGRIIRYTKCSFGCGKTINWELATIDHHPIPRRDGGRWVLENTRLACAPCNNGEGAIYKPTVGRYVHAVRKASGCYKNHTELHGIPSIYL